MGSHRWRMYNVGEPIRGWGEACSMAALLFHDIKGRGRPLKANRSYGLLADGLGARLRS